MDNKDLISVIVPVYNVQKYIAQCCQSIIDQTYKNLEIILVNDASTDESKKICCEYARNDMRIRVLDSKTNMGAGEARNLGIDVAHGKYFVFIDSDDFVALNYIEELYKVVIHTKSDITVCLGKSVYNGNSIEEMEKSVFLKYEIMDAKQAIENLCYQKKITPGPWAKIFSKELFNNIRFPNTGYEDLAIIYKLFDKAKKITFVSIAKYYYLQRNNNTTWGKFNIKKLDRILVAEQMREFICEKYGELIEAANTRCFLANIQTLNVLPFKMLNSKYAFEIKNNIKKYRWIVLTNKKVKLTIKIMAFMSCFGIVILKIMGMFYNILKGKYRVKLN